MRRLGQPEFGTAILREMRGDVEPPGNEDLPFERLIFGRDGVDVTLPPAAVGHEFRVYRAGEVMLVRNTGPEPLWIRGRSVATGSFLRLRERQPLVVPGWTLSYEDLMFFLDVKRTGNAPAIYLEAGAAYGGDGQFGVSTIRVRIGKWRASFGYRERRQEMFVDCRSWY